MTVFREVMKSFFNRVSNSRIAVVGSTIVAIIFPVLLVFVTLDLWKVVKNPYFGFLIYLIMGPLFAIGLILIIIGLLFSRPAEDIGLYTIEYLKEQFTLPGRFARVRRLLFLIYFLSFFTVILVVVLSYTGYRYTETVGFCTQFCHQVMEPEYVTYRNSPHSQISCVYCHIGEGAAWVTKAKFSGFRQIFATATDSYPRPIHTPIESLRPTTATCEKCHRPEIFHGDKLEIKHQYREDRDNTHTQTVMLMRVGSGGFRGEGAHGIHWHISPDHEIYYTHTDAARQDITRVTVRTSDGEEKVFTRKDLEADREELPATGETRLMDCIDCHNRPTHIFLGPDEALDRLIATGEIAASIPFIKQRAMAVITQEYASHEEAQVSISRQLYSWYEEHFSEYTGEKKPLLDRAVQAIYQAYAENVFPAMRITWGTYENFAGHWNDDTGCFRCHNEQLVDQQGRNISQDCRICHIVLAVEEEDPEIMRKLWTHQPLDPSDGGLPGNQLQSPGTGQNYIESLE